MTAKVKISAVCAAVAAAGALTLILLCCRGGMSKKMSAVYGFEEWRPRRSYDAVATNWWRSGLLSGIAGANVATNAFAVRPLHLDIVWEGDGQIGEGSIRIVETSGFSAAVDAMMQSFSRCSAVQPFPRAQGSIASIGDVCFTSFPQGSSNSLDFVRNNVYVSIDSDNAAVSCGIAASVDSAILDASTNVQQRANGGR